ncbi:MAG: hypothetical protein WAW06_01805 [bacterium]
MEDQTGLAKVTRRRRKISRRGLLLTASAFAALVAVSVPVYRSAARHTGQADRASNLGDGLLRAAIVDQLSRQAPNPGFVQRVTGILRKADYTVDYFPAAEVTVEFYRDLPRGRYDLVVLRTHSAPASKGTPKKVRATEEIGLFTGELHVPGRYEEEARAELLGLAYYTYEDYATGRQRPSVAVLPAFIRSRMRGDLGGAVVVLMGCETFKTLSAPKALFDRGAGAVIGWDGLIEGAYSDAVTELLVQNLSAGLPPDQAVLRTSRVAGQDPSSGARLAIYPADTPGSTP